MTRGQEEALARLEAELAERASLERELKGLRIVEPEAFEEIEGDEIQPEEVLKRIDRLIELEKRSHITFLKYILMPTLFRAEEARKAKEERLPGENKYDQEYMELTILENALLGVLALLDGQLDQEGPKITDQLNMTRGQFVSLFLLTTEIGRRLPLLSALTGQEELKWADLVPYSTDEGLQKLLHAHKSGSGGRRKAANERKQKMEILAPLFEELKKERFSGRYKSYRSAVEGLLDRDEFVHIRNHTEGMKRPFIAYDTFLYPEAKKIWEAGVRQNKSK